MKSIGQIISHYRKEAGLSQIALSKKLKDLGVEVSSKSISAWEHGRSEPSVETFLYICRILGIWDCIEVCFGSNPGDPLSVLNVDGKDMVISFIEMLRHSSQYLKPEHAPTNVSAALAPAATRHLTTRWSWSISRTRWRRRHRDLCAQRQHLYQKVQKRQERSFPGIANPQVPSDPDPPRNRLLPDLREGAPEEVAPEP